MSATPTTRYLQAALRRVPNFRTKLAQHLQEAGDVLENPLPESVDQLPPGEIEDLFLQPLMPDLDEPSATAGPSAPLKTAKDASVLERLMASRRRPVATFGGQVRELGKKAAWVQDIRVSVLPAEVRKDLVRFIPPTMPDPLVLHYGMTVSELLPRVDPENWKTARARIRAELGGLSAAALKKEVGQLMKRREEKYIFLVNDRIVDGHHFLAKADGLKVSSSLNVLDLTPVRFQVPAKK